jgi:hypothetical protein
MKKLFLAIGLFIALVASPAGAVVWVSPSGDAPGATGQGNLKAYGVNIHGGANIIGSTNSAHIGTPSAPTLSTNGTAGATSIVYACIAFDYNGLPNQQDSANADNPGQSIPSSTATITTGNATLSATNSVNVTCGGQVGALGYLIAKVDTSHVIGYCYTKSNTSCTFVDTGTYTNGDGSSTQTSSYTYTPNTIDETVGGTCSGQVTLVAGNAVVTAPCISNWTQCEAFSQAGTSAVALANGAVACKPTSTATVINSATVTVGAVSVSSAATPATSPIVNWTGGPR